MTIHPGEVFSRERLTKTNKAITDRFWQRGLRIRERQCGAGAGQGEAHGILYHLRRSGAPRYVRRINVGGNTKTRDEVVRREMRQMEGAWYDGEKINRSRTRIERLGYFDEVNVETPAVPSTTDQVDLNFSGQGARDGNLHARCRFRAPRTWSLSAAIAQQNLFGSEIPPVADQHQQHQPHYRVVVYQSVLHA